MGKGDKKSKRGKITIGTFGVRRLRKKNGKTTVAAVKAKEEIVKTVVIEETVEAVAEPIVVKENAPAKAAKPAKEEKKETKTAKTEKAVKTEKTVKESKAKKEKKAE